MAMHYRKLLSAKAAVDSSAPKCLTTSIKYRDQQKREMLIKAAEKFKKEVARIHSAPPCHSKSISRENPKWLQNYPNSVSRGRTSPLRKGEPSKRTCSHLPSPGCNTEDTVQAIWASSSLTYKNAVQQYSFPVVSLSRQNFQITNKKAVSGDLLDTHANWFTETKEPFTPKLLKSANKSFLSKYRYYNHPCKKKSPSLHPQSCRGPRKDYRSVEDEQLRSYTDDHLRHPLKKNSEKSVSVQSLLRAKEEELKYLNLLQEVTNDILIRSCYCKKAINDIFRMHIRNRHDLDEVKMQRIFQALKEDLNICTQISA